MHSCIVPGGKFSKEGFGLLLYLKRLKDQLKLIVCRALGNNLIIYRGSCIFSVH